jgi:hypothetical protein
MMRRYLLLLPLAACVVGCNSEVQVTKDQEATFRNPNKEIPPDIAEKMRKSMAAHGGPGGPPKNTPPGGSGSPTGSTGTTG